jgi:hypothetical protein
MLGRWPALALVGNEDLSHLSFARHFAQFAVALTYTGTGRGIQTAPKSGPMSLPSGEPGAEIGAEVPRISLASKRPDQERRRAMLIPAQPVGNFDRKRTFGVNTSLLAVLNERRLAQMCQVLCSKLGLSYEVISFSGEHVEGVSQGAWQWLEALAARRRGPGRRRRL